MVKITYENAEFLLSCMTIEGLPNLLMANGKHMPEIAIVGRSNVGKSSMINHLLKRKKLAKVSATPGKTQTLNYYIIDNKLALVDLPGFGYAKVAKELRTTWGDLVTEYLQNRSSLKLILHLVDSRRLGDENDTGFMQWCLDQGKEYLLIVTKCDQIDSRTIEKNLASYPIERSQYVTYSIKDDSGRQALRGCLQKLVKTWD